MPNPLSDGLLNVLFFHPKQNEYHLILKYVKYTGSQHFYASVQQEEKFPPKGSKLGRQISYS